VASVRRIALSLRPSMLDDLAGAALEWQAREIGNRTGLNVEIEAGAIAGELPDSHRTCIFRVAQEHCGTPCAMPPRSGPRWDRAGGAVDCTAGRGRWPRFTSFAEREGWGCSGWRSGSCSSGNFSRDDEPGGER